MVGKLLLAALIAVRYCPGAEILTLEQAIQTATRNNRPLRNATTEVMKAAAEAAAQRTHLYPAFKVYALGSQLLSPINFLVQTGLFGTYPGIGPVPATDTQISTPRRPAGFVIGTASQPLSTLYRIRLSLKLLDLNGQLAKEQARAGRQDLARDVKRVYYGIQQGEASLGAAQETVNLYREVEALTSRYLAEQTVLKRDHLQAQTRLARAEHDQASIQDQIDSGKEQLNHLMGRDVRTAFDVTPPMAATTLEADVEAARRRALDQRPEIREARLKLQQAQQDRRVKKAEYIPDVSASLNSITTLNLNSFLPVTINSMGLVMSWEPFDWGRKKHELAQKDGVIGQARNSATEAESQVLIDVNDKFRK